MSDFKVQCPEALEPINHAKRRKQIFSNPLLRDAFSQVPKRSKAMQLAEARQMIGKRNSTDSSSSELVAQTQHVTVPSTLVGLLQKAASSAHVLRVSMPLLAHVGQSFNQYARNPSVGPFHATAQVMNETLVGSATRTVASKTVTADSLGLHRRAVDLYVPQLANHIVHADRLAKTWVMGRLVASLPSASLVEYAEAERSDETPMPVCRKDRLAPTVDSVAAVVDGVPNASDSQMCLRGTFGKVSHQAVKSKSKLLQRESEWAVLVKLPDGPFVHMIGSTLNWVQVMERTTGEVYHAAYCRTLRRPVTADSFDGQSRMVCNDQASGIERAELKCDRDAPRMKRLQTHCDLHIAHIGHSNTCDLVKDYTPMGFISRTLHHDQDCIVPRAVAGTRHSIDPNANHDVWGRLRARHLACDLIVLA